MQHTTTLRGPRPELLPKKKTNKKKVAGRLKAAEGEPEPPKGGRRRGGRGVGGWGEGVVVRERNRHQRQDMNL